MDWGTGLGIINLVGIGMTIWLVLSQKSRETTGLGFDPKDLVSQILLGVSQQQSNQTQALTDMIGQTNLRQNQQLSDNLQNLERRFGELQIKITDNLNQELGKIQMLQNQTLQESKVQFNTQIQEQKTQFERIKADNQTALMQIQKALTEDLSRAIQHLIDLNKSELKSIQDLNKQSLDTIAKLNQDKLGQIQEEIERKLNDNLQQNLKSFEDVTKNLGHLQSTAQKMIESTSSIDKLNNLFERTSSKGFGSFGEKYLESLLGQYINRQNWSKQVKVPGSTEIIDFVIHYGEKSIGLDCKFPVTRYQDYLDAPAEQKRQAHQAYVRAVIQMAGEISAKYSKVGFVDSLLMYLPSDGMYLEVVNIPEAMDKLRSYRVTLTSPTTILPLIGLIHEYEFKLNVQERAGDIIKGLQIVKKNVISFREEFRKLGEKIRLAQQNYDSADRSLVNVQNEVLKLESNQETVVEADLQQGVF